MQNPELLKLIHDRHNWRYQRDKVLATITAEDVTELVDVIVAQQAELRDLRHHLRLAG